MALSWKEVDEQVMKRGGYHAVDVKDSRVPDDIVQMYFCRFSDGKYHLLGSRDHKTRAYFTEAEETHDDLGVATLPDGKTKLTDLVKGEQITITPEEGNPYQVEYIERS